MILHSSRAMAIGIVEQLTCMVHGQTIQQCLSKIFMQVSQVVCFDCFASVERIYSMYTPEIADSSQHFDCFSGHYRWVGGTHLKLSTFSSTMAMTSGCGHLLKVTPWNREGTRYTYNYKRILAIKGPKQNLLYLLASAKPFLIVKVFAPLCLLRKKVRASIQAVDS